MSLTSELQSAFAEIISRDSVTVTKSGGISFPARRNRGEQLTDGMRGEGYLADAELVLIATASALMAANYTPAVNDELTVSGKAYVVLTVKSDAAFTFIRAKKEK